MNLFGINSNEDKNKYKPVDAVDVGHDIDTFIEAGKELIFGNNLLIKYHSNLDSTFQHLTLFGTDELGRFFYFKNLNLPIYFGFHGNDSAISLIISGIYINYVYNTLKLTSRQRAAKVVTTYFLPALQEFTRNFKTNEIKYFGFTAIYGSKDLADDDDDSKSEFVGFIVSADLIRKYVSGDITEDELVNAADVYISDRDMIGDTKKIKIVLE